MVRFMTTYYTNINEINGEQAKIMQFISDWVHQKKTPVPLKKIMIEMKKQNVKEDTISYSITILIKKGYIRRAFGLNRENSSTAFVQLRTV